MTFLQFLGYFVMASFLLPVFYFVAMMVLILIVTLIDWVLSKTKGGLK